MGVRAVAALPSHTKAEKDERLRTEMHGQVIMEAIAQVKDSNILKQERERIPCLDSVVHQELRSPF